MDNNTIELTPEFNAALEAMQFHPKPVFITGKAGTGKSTILNYFKSQAKDKNIVIAAPTGIAAVNVGGVTLHSFFRFTPPFEDLRIEKTKDKERAEVYNKLETLLIDEVSMLSPKLLDEIDHFLRINRGKQIPFGGVRVVFIGDLYQLPPINKPINPNLLAFKDNYESPFFFSAHVIEKTGLAIFELNKIYRQEDPVFINLLNKIRINDIDRHDLDLLNQCHDPTFELPEDTPYITLSTTNTIVDNVNMQRLNALEGEKNCYSAEITGIFPENSFPAPKELEIKIGAQVMVLVNNRPYWYNGTIGTVKEIITKEDDNEEEQEYIVIETIMNKQKECIEVPRFTWDNYEFKTDEKEGLRSFSVGTFRQFPLRLAWAVTIHKSQGQTFENVIIDLGRGAFAPGQTYVALSRCRSMEGIILRKPIQYTDIFIDPAISRFFSQNRY